MGAWECNGEMLLLLGRINLWIENLIGQGHLQSMNNSVYELSQ